MVNVPSDTYWDVNGTSLNTYAWNVEQLLAGIGSVPPLRGDDLVIPGRTGRVFVPKVADSRTIELKMWVQGSDADGNIVDRSAFGANIRALRALLWTPTTQVTLTKRWKDTDGGGVTSASALAQVTGGLEVDVPEILDYGTTTVEFFLADPYFHGAGSTVYL